MKSGEMKSTHPHAINETINETRLRVRYAETDQMGVVYHSNHFIWFVVDEIVSPVNKVAYAITTGVGETERRPTSSATRFLSTASQPGRACS